MTIIRSSVGPAANHVGDGYGSNLDPYLCWCLYASDWNIDRSHCWPIKRYQGKAPQDNAAIKGNER